jgi:hypothetical protein
MEPLLETLVELDRQVKRRDLAESLLQPREKQGKKNS